MNENSFISGRSGAPKKKHPGMSMFVCGMGFALVIGVLMFHRAEGITIDVSKVSHPHGVFPKGASY